MKINKDFLNATYHLAAKHAEKLGSAKKHISSNKITKSCQQVLTTLSNYFGEQLGKMILAPDITLEEMKKAQLSKKELLDTKRVFIL